MTYASCLSLTDEAAVQFQCQSLPDLTTPRALCDECLPTSSRQHTYRCAVAMLTAYSRSLQHRKSEYTHEQPILVPLLLFDEQSLFLWQVPGQKWT